MRATQRSSSRRAWCPRPHCSATCSQAADEVTRRFGQSLRCGANLRRRQSPPSPPHSQMRRPPRLPTTAVTLYHRHLHRRGSHPRRLRRCGPHRHRLQRRGLRRLDRRGPRSRPPSPRGVRPISRSAASHFTSAPFGRGIIYLTYRPRYETVA